MEMMDRVNRSDGRTSRRGSVRAAIHKGDEVGGRPGTLVVTGFTHSFGWNKVHSGMGDSRWGVWLVGCGKADSVADEEIIDVRENDEAKSPDKVD
ncbi:hypothetical protein SAMD00023353_0200630 [Rosellinia necatrix]|uniref:Uncharacterized protein n=1 Tax=Rosellinia necatrix TaxID=77044 RepID=A0A1S8A4W3_ROSNE|nr:hypothetical protein SAMD00023353_0200630 [Rosellinia necatrix]